MSMKKQTNYNSQHIYDVCGVITYFINYTHFYKVIKHDNKLFI